MGRMTKQQAGEYVSMIVGRHTSTSTVRWIWLRRDGGMTSNEQVHYPIGGRTAENEAVVVFGLSRIKTFTIHSEDAAKAYAQKLQAEIDAKPEE